MMIDPYERHAAAVVALKTGRLVVLEDILTQER